jgi:hypothetical protein
VGERSSRTDDAEVSSRQDPWRVDISPGSLQESLHPYVFNVPLPHGTAAAQRELVVIQLPRPMNFSHVIQRLITLKDFVRLRCVGVSAEEAKVMSEAAMGYLRGRVNLEREMGVFFVIPRESL